MGGLRGWYDERQRFSGWAGELPASAIALALALHRATYSGEADVSLNDLAGRVGLPILDALAVAQLLEKRSFVRILPWTAERLAPVDWLASSREKQLQLMGRTIVRMTPFLPSLLEGQLDYSPSADEAEVAAVLHDIAPEKFPHPDELVARIKLPARRAREALARYTRGPARRRHAHASHARHHLPRDDDRQFARDMGPSR